MIKLRGIEREMKMEISPGGAFISGCNDNNCYIWKRNAEEPASYEVFYHRDAPKSDDHLKCFFSNDSIVSVLKSLLTNRSHVIDLDTGYSHSIDSGFRSSGTLIRSFCISKKRVFITVSHDVITFFDMDFGAALDLSYQRYMNRNCLKAIWCLFVCLFHQILC